MTSSNDLKQQFITLRAKGYSLDKISKELGKCRQTLSNWNWDLQEEIANAKAIEMESLFEECFLLKEHRIKNLSSLLYKVEEELKARDFKMVSDEKLIDLKLKISQQLKEEFFEPIIHSESEIDKRKKNRQFDW